jgi:hypothetical protein
MFAVVGLLWSRADAAGRWFAQILVAGILLAILSELGQALPIVNRDAGFADGLADVLGVIVSVLIARWILWPIGPPRQAPS